MPPERHIPVSPRKDQIYCRPSPVESSGDPPFQHAQLPSYSELPPYNKIPLTHISPYRITTPPPSACGPSSLAMRSPASPATPTSYPESPRPTLPPISSFFQELKITHHGGYTSPSKDREHHKLGLPMADSPNKAKNRKVVPQSAGPTTKGGMPPSDRIICGWRDCSWSEHLRSNNLWSRHLNEHFEPAEDGKAKCKWDTDGDDCGKRVTKGCWVNHLRYHDRRFIIYCPRCPREYVTTNGFEKHMASEHPSVAGNGASGSGSYLQNMDDDVEVKMEDQTE